MGKNKKKYIVLGIVALVVLGIAGAYLSTTNIPVIQPKGEIGQQQLDLILIGLGLSLIVVIPVFIMTFMIAYKYRETNTSAKYTPEWDGNPLAEVVWWLIPTALILVLGVIIWQSSYKLDPYKSLNSANKQVNIQVVSLDWKWLFIYPDQKIASVNYVQFPRDTPVSFELTSDAPMNSFWIPQLGGQIYTMPGMSTKLHLNADTKGRFYGSSANISGKGFAGMTFVAESKTKSDFDAWVKEVRRSPNTLNAQAYDKLSRPSQNNPASFYRNPANDLYNQIMMKYMMPNMKISDSGLHKGTTQ